MCFVGQFHVAIYLFNTDISDCTVPEKGPITPDDAHPGSGIAVGSGIGCGILLLIIISVVAIVLGILYHIYKRKCTGSYDFDTNNCEMHSVLPDH